MEQSTRSNFVGLPAAFGGRLGHGADHGVQARAISAANDDSDSLTHEKPLVKTGLPGVPSNGKGLVEITPTVNYSGNHISPLIVVSPIGSRLANASPYLAPIDQPHVDA